MVVHAHFHKLSQFRFDFSMYKRTIVNFRPGEKPDNYSSNDGLYIIVSWVG